MPLRFLLLVALIALALPSAAGARTWSAKVKSVRDGDTIEVDLSDRSKRTFLVRLIAIQAMEQTVYSRRLAKRRGDCHSLEATAYLERLVRRSRGRVRLTASHAGPKDVMGRLRRFVAVRIGGRWQDAGLKMIQAGHAVWLPATDETAFNRAYNIAQQEAAHRGRNLWDPQHCGAGPAQDVPLRVWAYSDQIGNDEKNPGDEWLKVRNLSPSRSLDLDRWWARDSNLRRFTFPSGTRLAPGATATVHTGPGSRTFSWGLPEPIFENANTPNQDFGDGVYLFDPAGDLRAWMLWPCRVACTDLAQGALEIDARPQRPETVTVRNTSGRAFELYGYQLSLPGSSWPFPAGAVVGSGQTYTVDVAQWDDGRYLLPEPGGSVRLSTFSSVTIACDAWGSGSC